MECKNCTTIIFTIYYHHYNYTKVHIIIILIFFFTVHTHLFCITALVLKILIAITLFASIVLMIKKSIKCHNLKKNKNIV